jgi:hypothetical protein
LEKVFLNKQEQTQQIEALQKELKATKAPVLAPPPDNTKVKDREEENDQLLAQLHLAQGQRLRALRAEGEAQAAQLNHSGAAERFKAAQALPAAERAADPIELAIVDARRREVEAQLRESLRDN